MKFHLTSKIVGDFLARKFVPVRQILSTSVKFKCFAGDALMLSRKFWTLTIEVVNLHQTFGVNMRTGGVT